jgi:hypothetical protein
MSIHDLLDTVEWVEVEGDPPEDDDLPYATHEGTLTLQAEGASLKCYQLNNGQCVFEAESLMRFLGVLYKDFYK